jgi:hypothetical protein
VEYELSQHGNDCDVMKSFTPAQLPVLTFLAQEYCVMDRYGMARAEERRKRVEETTVRADFVDHFLVVLSLFSLVFF